MRVDLTEAGPVVAAEDLAPLLDLEPAALPRLMRTGVLKGQHEAGTDEDAGRFRLTFSYENRRVRLTCTDDGEVISHSRWSVGKSSAERSD
jgi:hypothetical protein